jgi:hypothetical protein
MPEQGGVDSVFYRGDKYIVRACVVLHLTGRGASVSACPPAPLRSHSSLHRGGDQGEGGHIQHIVRAKGVTETSCRMCCSCCGRWPPGAQAVSVRCRQPSLFTTLLQCARSYMAYCIRRVVCCIATPSCKIHTGHIRCSLDGGVWMCAMGTARGSLPDAHTTRVYWRGMR